ITVDKITDTMGSKLVEHDTVLFKNKSDTAARRAAEAFVRKTDLLHIGTERVYFDANTGEQVTLDESRSLDDVEYGYLVKLQTKGVYFFESRAQAHRFKEENPEQHSIVYEPEDRLGEGYHAHMLTGTQMATLIKSIRAREDISEGTRRLMETVIAQASARMLSGNRITS